MLYGQGEHYFFKEASQMHLYGVNHEQSISEGNPIHADLT